MASADERLDSGLPNVPNGESLRGDDAVLCRGQGLHGHAVLRVQPTPRQRQALAFVVNFVTESGYPPTLPGGPVLSCALLTACAFAAGFIVRHVMRDDRLREVERQLLASRKACANKEIECERLDQRLWEAEAEITRLREGRGGDPEAAE